MADFIKWVMEHFGYAGVTLLTFGETIFPPLPSEVIIPLAGLQAQQGAMNFPGVVAAGTLGSMVGNFVWYALARRFGEDRFRRLVERHGRWLTADWTEIERAQRYFTRHGAAFVFAGRILPAIRTFVSVPAGLLRMRLWPYLAWSTLGTSIWTGALAYSGWALGSRYPEIERIIGPLTLITVGPLLCWYLWRLIASFSK